MEEKRESGYSSAEQMIALLKSIDEAMKLDTSISPSSEWLGKWLKSIDDSLRTIKNILVFYAILTVLAFVLAFCSALINF